MENKKPLSYIIFRQANALIRASGLIETETAKVFAEKREVDDRIEMLHSVVLLRSLAIELYLKTILIIKYDDVFSIEDIKTRSISFPTGRDGHNFIALLDPIQDDAKDIIVKEFNKLDQKVKTLDDLKYVINKIGSTPFVDWRYIYEKSMDTTMSLIDLTNLAEALCQTAGSIKGTRLI